MQMSAGRPTEQRHGCRQFAPEQRSATSAREPLRGTSGELSGFLVDEPRETLDRGLSLPPWLEAERSTLERELSPIT